MGAAVECAREEATGQAEVAAEETVGLFVVAVVVSQAGKGSNGRGTQRRGSRAGGSAWEAGVDASSAGGIRPSTTGAAPTFERS